MSHKSSNTWWSGRFLRSLERLGLVSPSRQARDVVQAVRVLSLAVGPGWVESRVQIGQEFVCRMEFAPLTDLEWEESFERLAFSDLSAAALLTTGRLPPQIEDFFIPSGRLLLPQSAEDLEFSCSCRAPAGLCQHLTATVYQFAERLDRDPWLLFLIRGRSSEEVMEALAQRWNRSAEPRFLAPNRAAIKAEQAEPLTSDIDRFWSAPAPIEMDLGARTERRIHTARRLGSPEPKVDLKDWTELLSEIYAVVAQRAQGHLEG